MITLKKQHRGYENYQDGGVEFLGKIPAKWSVTRLDKLFTQKKETSTAEEELLSVYRDYGVIIKSSRDDNFNKPSEDLSNYILVQPGDLVINKMKTWQGSLGISKYRGIVSPAYFTYKLGRNHEGKVHLPYFHHLLRSAPYIEAYLRISNGIRPQQWDLDPYQFKILPIIIPAIEKQQSIASYLDEKCALIDQIIAGKKKQIDMLHEQRASVIENAVSGAKHQDWQSIPIKFLMQRMDYGISENLKGDGEIKVLTMGNVQDGSVIIPENGCIDTVETDLFLRKNDLLFNRTNSFDLVGKVGVYEEESNIKVTFASYLVRMRTNEKADPHFLNYVLNSESFLSYVRSLAWRSLHQANLNPTRYGQLHIRIPSIQEQRRIAADLNRQFQEINNRFSIIEASITLLNEYKTSLISHVVTGKIRIS